MKRLHKNIIYKYIITYSTASIIDLGGIPSCDSTILGEYGPQGGNLLSDVLLHFFVFHDGLLVAYGNAHNLIGKAAALYGIQCAFIRGYGKVVL